MLSRARALANAALIALIALASGSCVGSREPAAIEWRELLVPSLAGDASKTDASATSAPAWREVPFGGSGGVERGDFGVRLLAGAPLTGIVWDAGAAAALDETPLRATLAAMRAGDYELEVAALRRAGTDFFCALTFPVGADCVTLVLGGWGGSTCGLSCLDGRDASSNPTTTYRKFVKGEPVRARVRVGGGRVQAWCDDALLVDVATAGVRLAVRTEVEPCQPLGIASYATEAEIASLRWRPLPAAVR